MTTYNLSPIGNGTQFFTAGGVVLAGGFLACYAAGTNTPQAAYTTNLGVAWATSIPLGTDGRIAGEVWLPAGVAYKFILLAADGITPIANASWDNIVGINDVSLSFSNFVATGLVPTYSSATQFTVVGNQTSVFPVGTRVQAVVTAGTVYGSVSVSSFSVATTVTLIMDPSESLDSGLSSVAVSSVSPLSTPSIFPGTLKTAGNFAVAGNATVSGTLGVTGNTTVGGTLGVTGAATVGGTLGVTGNLTVGSTVINASTGAISASAGFASSITGALRLGLNWGVDSAGQLRNLGATMFAACWSSSATQSSGNAVLFQTANGQNGSNFSLTTGTLTATAAGLYEVTVNLLMSISSTQAENLYFVPGAGTILTGPTSGAPQAQELVAGYPSGVGMKCLWDASAGDTLQVYSGTAFTGNYLVYSGSNIFVRTVG